MQPSVCVCLLPRGRHSSPGYSWTPWGWTPTILELLPKTAFHLILCNSNHSSDNFVTEQDPMEPS